MAKSAAAYREYRHPERASLIKELLENLQIAGEPLHAETQAFLWLSQIGSLWQFVRRSRRLRKQQEDSDKEDEEEDDDNNVNNDDDDDMDNSLPVVLTVGYRAVRVSETWTTRARQPKVPVEHVHGEHNPAVRHEEAKEQTRKRNKERCIITGMDGPLKVVHIYPSFLNAHTGPPCMVAFWSTLRCFWSNKKVNAWKKAVLGKKGTETPANMITLSLTVHKLWGNCYLALKPIKVSENRRKMTMQFHWLRPKPKAARGKLLVDFAACPDSFAEYDSPVELRLELHHADETYLRLQNNPKKG